MRPEQNQADPATAAAPLFPVQRWRLVLARAPGDIVQRDHELAWEAALEASGLPCARATSGRRGPRITFAVPLPTGIAGEAELAEILLVSRCRSQEVRVAIEAVIPPATRLVDLYDVWLGAPGLPSLVTAADYRIDVGPGIAEAAVRSAADELLAASQLPRTRGADRRYDLRPLLDRLTVEATPAPATPRIRCRLRHDQALGTGRPDELIAAIGERLAPATVPVIAIVRERLVLAGD